MRGSSVIIFIERLTDVYQKISFRSLELLEKKSSVPLRIGSACLLSNVQKPVLFGSDLVWAAYNASLANLYEGFGIT